MSGKAKIHIRQGDITESDADAIVNAANTDLWLGGGVGEALRKKCGAKLQEACSKLAPIERGEAAITGGGALKAKHIIHAASMSLDDPTTDESLYDAVKNSLLRASELQLKSIAFPVIGDDSPDFDPQNCAEIMLSEILRILPETPSLEKVELVLLDPEIHQIFAEEYQKL